MKYVEAKFREMASAVMVQVGRDLRQRETTAEAYLWNYLRDRQLNGLKFRRQHPIANTSYIADFFCYEVRLVIELDGGIHDYQQNADAIRQQDIEAQGNHVIRFSNDQVFADPQTVLATLLAAHDAISSGPATSRFPSP